MSLRRTLASAATAPLLLAAGTAHAEGADAGLVLAAAAADVSGVIVTAPKDDAYRAERTASATKTDTPLIDVPQAVSVITDELIRDQSMRGMADVLRYVPGASMGQGEGHRDAPTLRGQSSTSDFFVDGVRDDVQYFRDLYNVERVEVLKGPNAMIFGRGGGGGVINRVTKKADWADHRAVSAELGSWEHRRFTADAGAAFSDALAARVVGLYEDSGSFRDFVQVERWGVNPSLGWRNGEGLTVSLAYERFEDERTVDRGIPSFQGRPSPASRSAFFGDPDQSYATTEADFLNLAAEYAAPSGLVVRNRTVFGAYDKFYQNVFAGGAASAGAGGGPATVPLSAYNNRTGRQNLFNQTDLVWTARLGGMEHTLLAGVELGRQETDNFRNTGFFAASPFTVPFASPTLRGAPATFRQSASDADNGTTATVAAVYVQDQIEITPQLQLLAGLRFDSFDLDFHNNRNGQELSRRDELWSPRVGVVFKPAAAVSLYASYGVSYLPASGDQFSSLSASSAALEPEEFENLEAGVKWQATPDLMVSAALYRLDRENTTAPDPNNPGRVVLTGKQRTEGFEAEVVGRITERWEVAGGYAWQDARIVRTTSAAPAGRKAPLVPEHSFSLWNKYELTPMFAAGLGVVRQTKTYASIGNTVTLPGFTRVDAALYVRLNDTLRAQVNVENVFDKRYFPTSHGDNNILPGSPRAVRVGLTAEL